MDKETDNIWRVRNVPLETRKKIRLYSISRGITVAEALEELVESVSQRGVNLPAGNHTINGAKVVVSPGTKVTEEK